MEPKFPAMHRLRYCAEVPADMAYFTESLPIRREGFLITICGTILENSEKRLRFEEEEGAGERT